MRSRFARIALTIAVMGSTLAAGSAAAAGVGVAYRDVVLSDHPVAYWRLGETAGTVARDETANHRDGIYSGGPLLGLAGAIARDPDTSAGFEGIHTQEFAAWKPDTTLAGIFTVELWVKPRGPQAPEPDFLGTLFPGDHSFIMRLSNGHFFDVDVGDGSGWLVTAGVDLPFRPGRWFYLAATVSTGKLSMYANGRPVGTFPFTGTPLLFDSSHGVVIGASGKAGRAVRGQVDEVAIYDVALTPYRIVAHFAAGRTRAPG